MLVVISDLHFEEERLDRVGAAGDSRAINLVRNFSSDAFRKFRDFLIRQATPGRPVDLVLAGDIFDLHRTALWFDSEIRPWDDFSKFRPGSAREAKVLAIIAAIANEPDVRECLSVLAELPAAIAGARVHYLPGNHDRLVDATPATRNAVRALLGLAPSPDPFSHTFLAQDPPVLVRHGHEYDRFNFAADLATAKIPLDVPKRTYWGATFGDFITVEVAARLPALFRAKYGDEILTNPELRHIYLRLLQFDDVRPQSALVEFLLRMPGEAADEERLWRHLEPVVREILETVHDHPFLTGWLAQFDTRFRPDLVDLVQLMLKTQPWRLGLPLWVLRQVAGAVRDLGAAGEKLVTIVQKEEVLASGAVRAVIAGHTHEPQVALLDASNGAERYYIDTGTWRKRVPATPDELGFGQLKALTYVAVYGRNEDPGKEQPPAGSSKLWSFDYWSGFTQRWWG